jgi:hypothetical protein
LFREENILRTFQLIVLLLFLILVQANMRAQGEAQEPSGGNQQSNPVAAPSSRKAPPSIAENPPITGLDMPGLETNVARRSFFIPGAQVSEALDSNIGSEPGATAIHPETRVLGSLALQKLWSRYNLLVDYVGGGAFYHGTSFGPEQIHALNFVNRFVWPKGQFAIRDAFSYLPEGTFGFGAFGGGSAYGGYQSVLSGIGFGLPAGGFGSSLNFFGAGQFGSLGLEPLISNVTVVDFAESLSPRSSVTLAGAYAIQHYTDNPLNLIDSRQTSAQAGYDYALNAKDMLAVLYGFQQFHYPSFVGAGTFKTNLINLFYGHRISGRLDFVIGAGPQITHTQDPVFGAKKTVAGSGRFSLRYRYPKTAFALSYEHYNNSGSGLFAGASSDVAQLTISRPAGRKWDWVSDIGYSHGNQLQRSIAGVNAGSLSYGYVGFALRRQLGRQFGAFISYQFNDEGFGNAFCGVGVPTCDKVADRHVVAVGLDWHPRPIRLD